MPIPTYDQLLRPILELASQGDITRKSTTAAMILEFNLTEEEQNARINSGALYIRNRTGWAMSYLTKGVLIEKVAKFTYRATDKGKDYLKSHQGPITPSDLRKIKGYKEAWQEASKKNAAKKGAEQETSVRISDSSDTPEEIIDEAVKNGLRPKRDSPFQMRRGKKYS